MATQPKTIGRKPVIIHAAERAFVEALKLYTPDGTEEPLIEASDALTAVTAAVRQRGGKGEVAVKLIVSGQGKQLSLTVQVTKKEPTRKPPGKLLFADEGGHLVTHDPDQFTFEEELQAKE